MAEPLLSLFAAIDTGTATVVAAIFAAFAAVGVRWVPKTRSEAKVDEMTAWHELNAGLLETVEAQRTEIGHLRRELGEERVARSALADEVGRLRILIDRA